MAAPAALSVRPASEDDRSKLNTLLHFETYVHRHLDWRGPLDWLGKSPYMVIERRGRLAAALACPPDPPGVAWLRLYACAARLNAEEAWTLLWPAAREKLVDLDVNETIAIPLQKWFGHLLAESKFEHTHDVVVLEWKPVASAASNGNPLALEAIRPMTANDLEKVEAVDHAGFPPIWRHSLETFRFAFSQSAVATVIELEQEVVAYQISTYSSQGLHLARLAVHPDWQGQHLALSLVRDLQSRVHKESMKKLSVNTQEINEPSLALYAKAGFERTGEAFPVYQYKL